MWMGDWGDDVCLWLEFKGRCGCVRWEGGCVMKDCGVEFGVVCD